MEFRNINRTMQNQLYMNSMRPVLREQGLFSDMTQDYVTPSEPKAYSEVTIRFRAAKNNIDNVFLVSKEQKHYMIKERTDDTFDYYYHTFMLDAEPVRYHFEVVCGRVICYYDLRGVMQSPNLEYDFLLVPGFSTPDWAKGAVFYQIYVDRFCRGDDNNDVLTNEYCYIGNYAKHIENWDQYPSNFDVCNFYGGDLQGVMDKLDYLKELGVDCIYFNPLFVSPSNHKYDIQDYDYIDPHIGKIVHDQGELLQDGDKDNTHATRYIDRVTNLDNLEASNAFFAKLVEEAHARGMKVILDGVFNHCGSFNKWLDREHIYDHVQGYEKGAYVDRNSPYHDYFYFYEPEDYRWPNNGSYDGWWGHDTLPKLNYEGSRNLYDYILYVGRKWVSPPYNCDGWRLDVAADLGHSKEFNHQFWRDFRRNIKQANPNAIVLAEHYGSPKEWLCGDQWDTVMNYDAFMEPVTWFLTGMQKHSDDYREDMYGNADNFFGAMIYNSANFTTPSLQVAMNELSNHDHSRFLTRTNKKVGRSNNLGSDAANEGIDKSVMREAVLIQMTWPGAPTIYYGDEAGVCGFTDPDNRRTYPWGKEDQELIAFHKDMIRIHKSSDALKKGSVLRLKGEYQFLAYARFLGDEKFVILVNNAEVEVQKQVNVWQAGIPKDAVLVRKIMTERSGYNCDPEEILVIGGKIEISLSPKCAMVLSINTKKEE